MHERQRAEIVRKLLAERGFVSIADIMAATGASARPSARATPDALPTPAMPAAPWRHPGWRGVLPADDAEAARDALVRRQPNASTSTAKRAIARKAVELCEDGESIIINGGTTTFQMVEFLRDRRLKILTNSFPLAELLIHESKNRVALPGGAVYREQNLIVVAVRERRDPALFAPAACS